MEKRGAFDSSSDSLSSDFKAVMVSVREDGGEGEEGRNFMMVLI